MNDLIHIQTACITEDFYHLYREPLLALLSSRVADQAIAEDILHDVFEKFELCGQSGKQCQYPKAYLFRMALNSLSDYYRKREHQELELRQIGLEMEEEPSPDSDCDLKRCLYSLLDQLSPENKQAILHVDLYQIPQHELAKEWELPLSTLKSRVQRGRKYLAKALLDCMKEKK